MKIGEFSAKHGVPRDTIRYYIKLGLLMPLTQGSQLHFTEADDRDMEKIRQYKAMHLNLDEIRILFYLHRMSNGIEPATLQQCRDILEHKETELEQQKQDLEQSLSLLHAAILEVKARSHPARGQLSGVPLAAASLLACPHCHQQLHISQAEIRGKYILQGELSCPCGYHATIQDGVVLTGNLYTGCHDTPDLERKLYHETGRQFSVVGPRAPEYMLQQLRKLDPHHQVIFEANINGFFFTYNFLPSLPHDCIYVIVDKYPEVLRLYKSLIESMYRDLDILYIADASEKLPLARHSLDIYVAFFGETEYCYYHKTYQLHDIMQNLKPGARLIGTMPSFPLGSVSRKQIYEKYPEGMERMCSIVYLKEDYARLGVPLQTQLLGTVTETLKHHMFTAHKDGEPLDLYGYTGQIKGV